LKKKQQTEEEIKADKKRWREEIETMKEIDAGISRHIPQMVENLYPRIIKILEEKLNAGEENSNE